MSLCLRVVSAVLLACVCAPWGARAEDQDIKLEAVLVWGTNDAQSPDPRHKPVTEEVAKKLAGLPFKYTNYFEVNRKSLTLGESAPARTRLSKDCEVSVRRLGKGQVEVTLFGRGQPVGTITQKLKKGEALVTGGNAANFTAWFVVLKQVE